jgi:hypothetical protein|eukprot:SAG25_NODE_1440_length_3014_cov_9.919370_5_plen_116_part_00
MCAPGDHHTIRFTTAAELGTNVAPIATRLTLSFTLRACLGVRQRRVCVYRTSAAWALTRSLLEERPSGSGGGGTLPSKRAAAASATGPSNAAPRSAKRIHGTCSRAMSLMAVWHG